MANFELTEELKAKLEATKSMEELAAVFTAEGMETTAEQLEAILKNLDSEELDENALENVAGGVSAGVIRFVAHHAVYILRIIRKYTVAW